MEKDQEIRELIKYLEGNVEDSYHLDYMDVEYIVEALEKQLISNLRAGIK